MSLTIPKPAPVSRSAVRTSPSGSTGMPMTCTSQCRCGPVASPVMPTCPKRLPGCSTVALPHQDLGQVVVDREEAGQVLDDHRLPGHDPLALPARPCPSRRPRPAVPVGAAMSTPLWMRAIRAAVGVAIVAPVPVRRRPAPASGNGEAPGPHYHESVGMGLVRTRASARASSVFRASGVERGVDRPPVRSMASAAKAFAGTVTAARRRQVLSPTPAWT